MPATDRCNLWTRAELPDRPGTFPALDTLTGETNAWSQPDRIVLLRSKQFGERTEDLQQEISSKYGGWFSLGGFRLPATESTGSANLASPQSQAWFAAYTSPRHEKRVAQHLITREIEHFVPLYRTHRRWRDGSRVTLELPLFPNYVFVRIPMAERIRVLNVPGVLYIVEGIGKKPAILPEADINGLRAGLQQCHAEPHPYLTVGERAIIRSGPFAGMKGVVVRTRAACRIVLSLDLIRKSIAVEVGVEDLEPLPPQRKHTLASS
jgi:transcription antitermination factor NusG